MISWKKSFEGHLHSVRPRCYTRRCSCSTQASRLALLRAKGSDQEPNLPSTASTTFDTTRCVANTVLGREWMMGHTMSRQGSIWNVRHIYHEGFRSGPVLPA
eukprot:scaffold18285_cov35-Tisochrysis_lutea.AAC.10